MRDSLSCVSRALRRLVCRTLVRRGSAYPRLDRRSGARCWRCWRRVIQLFPSPPIRPMAVGRPSVRLSPRLPACPSVRGRDALTRRPAWRAGRGSFRDGLLYLYDGRPRPMTNDTVRGGAGRRASGRKPETGAALRWDAAASRHKWSGASHCWIVCARGTRGARTGPHCVLFGVGLCRARCLQTHLWRRARVARVHGVHLGAGRGVLARTHASVGAVIGWHYGLGGRARRRGA